MNLGKFEFFSNLEYFYMSFFKIKRNKMFKPNYKLGSKTKCCDFYCKTHTQCFNCPQNF